MKINFNFSSETKESLRESRMQDECSKQESQQEQKQEQQKEKRRRRKGVINGHQEWKDILDQIHRDHDIHLDDISNDGSSSSSSSSGFPKRKMDYYEAVYHPPTHRLESEMFFQKSDQKLSQTLMFSSCLRYVQKR